LLFTREFTLFFGKLPSPSPFINGIALATNTSVPISTDPLILIKGYSIKKCEGSGRKCLFWYQENPILLQGVKNVTWGGKIGKKQYRGKKRPKTVQRK